MSPTPTGVLRVEEVEDWEIPGNATENRTTIWQNPFKTFTAASLLTVLVMVLRLDWQPGINPVLLASSIVPHVRITQRRQITGSVLGSISSRAGAVNDDLGGFIRQKGGSEFCNSIRRQINRTGKMGVVIRCGRQSFD